MLMIIGLYAPLTPPTDSPLRQVVRHRPQPQPNCIAWRHTMYSLANACNHYIIQVTWLSIRHQSCLRVHVAWLGYLVRYLEQVFVVQFLILLKEALVACQVIAKVMTKHLGAPTSVVVLRGAQGPMIIISCSVAVVCSCICGCSVWFLVYQLARYLCRLKCMSYPQRQLFQTDFSGNGQSLQLGGQLVCLGEICS